ncbi:hypothetical protein [Streptomyces venezuelae]|uniref:hypothetical protein n=1 Tax=Streptomyces venezuelae TaxID=54571 RepID=UPI001CC23A0D|nr:hypothetical protein [Streptomyces venezuelae]
MGVEVAVPISGLLEGDAVAVGSPVPIEDELVGAGWVVGLPVGLAVGFPVGSSVGLVVAAFVKAAVISAPGLAVISTEVVSSR